MTTSAPVQLLRHPIDVALGVRVELGMILTKVIVEIRFEGESQIAFRALVDGHCAHSPLTLRGFSISGQPQAHPHCEALLQCRAALNVWHPRTVSGAPVERSWAGGGTRKSQSKLLQCGISARI
jgi:hypothetical protein